jgi:hypothetical protein
MTHAGESYNCTSVDAIAAMARASARRVVQSAEALRTFGHACPS